MLDVLNLITLLGAVQGIFFALVLFRLQKGNRLANRLLALFLLNFAAGMIGICLYSSQWVLRVPHLGLLHAPFNAVTAVPMYLYFLALTRVGFRLKRRHWLYFLPFLVVFLLFLPFYVSSAYEKTEILKASYSVLPLSWKISFLFSLLANLAGFAATYLLIIRHERIIREVYSTPLNHTLLWARHFFYAGLATFGVCVFVSFFDINWADPVSNLLFSVIIYVFGYRAIRQPEIFTDIGWDAVPMAATVPLLYQPAKYEKSGLSKARAQTLLAEMERVMTTEKLYLAADLNLQQLAERLHVPPHHLSQLLNQYKGENFSDYINRFRVEYFKEAAASPANRHYSILGIAYESGFNSKASFNAVFKKMTGQTPSEFRSGAF